MGRTIAATRDTGRLLPAGHQPCSRTELAADAGPYRRAVRGQRHGHRDHPGAVVDESEQPVAAGQLPGSGNEPLPLAAVRPAGLDRGHHSGRIRLLRRIGAEPGPGAAGLDLLRGGGPVRTGHHRPAVLAARDAGRLHLGPDRRYRGLVHDAHPAPVAELRSHSHGFRYHRLAGQCRPGPLGVRDLLLAPDQQLAVRDRNPADPSIAERAGGRLRLLLRNLPAAGRRRGADLGRAVPRTSRQDAGERDRRPRGRAGAARPANERTRNPIVGTASTARAHRTQSVRPDRPADGAHDHRPPTAPGRRGQDRARRLHASRRRATGDVTHPAARPHRRTRQPAPTAPTDSAGSAAGRMRDRRQRQCGDVELRHGGPERYRARRAASACSSCPPWGNLLAGFARAADDHMYRMELARAGHRTGSTCTKPPTPIRDSRSSVGNPVWSC